MNCNIIHASCKGQKEGHLYQDFLKVIDNGCYLLAVIADGLGSAKCSSRGANLICISVAEQFRKNFHLGKSVNEILENAISCWYVRLEEKSVSPQECLTTSSVVFVDKERKRAFFAHIGDSLLAYRCDNMPAVCITENKEFLNETSCIGTIRRPHYDIQIADFETQIDFIVASDGFGDEIVLEKIDALFNYLKKKYSRIRNWRRNALLKHELIEVMQHKNYDDKSVIFGWIN